MLAENAPVRDQEDEVFKYNAILRPHGGEEELGTDRAEVHKYDANNHQEGGRGELK